MIYDITKIASVFDDGKSYINCSDNMVITNICLDSRYVTLAEQTLFFALKGNLHDGHQFIKEIYKKGVRNFVVSADYEIPEDVLESNFLKVEDPLKALQKLAAFHRSLFKNIICIGVTGSNGKTTVKEWLGTLLYRHEVVRSPKSYNSQTGVPLSLWLIQAQHEVGIFESGISIVGEMERLEKMIQPNLGIFTNIGDAHSAGFDSMKQKVEEKLLLFKGCTHLIYEEDDLLIAERIHHQFPDKIKLSWGKTGLFIQVIHVDIMENRSILYLQKDRHRFEIEVPFSDEASLQNVKHCITLLCYLEYEIEEIQKEILKLHNLPMRLEMKQGEYNNMIINDTYNADIQSFKIALEFLDQHVSNREKVVFLSAFDQTGKTSEVFLETISNMVLDADVKRVYAIGDELKNLAQWLEGKLHFEFFESTSKTLIALKTMTLENKAILIKGGRRFGMERVANVLSQKWHDAVLETDLQAVGHNLRYFSSLLQNNTGIIAVIKASAYGSGSHELAEYLEYSKVDYLAVAYVDEGIVLRKWGIKTPIMVLNSSSEQWNECMTWHLEPEVYSLEYIEKLLVFEGGDFLKVHIKLDTGMYRLGLLETDLPAAKKMIAQWPANIMVGSIFTHLVSTEAEVDDDFTKMQVNKYLELYDDLSSVLVYSPKKHVLNTAGIKRFPSFHFDYVRLGLGMYGVDVTGKYKNRLEKVHTLKARVLQIKEVRAGETVGYNRVGHMKLGGRVAVINIGYADGLFRLAGNGNFKVMINGTFFPIIGNINMDLTILDIGKNQKIHVGDEVEIFGKNVPVESLAQACKTIPYEILTRIASRVKRIYVKG